MPLLWLCKDTKFKVQITESAHSVFTGHPKQLERFTGLKIHTLTFGSIHPNDKKTFYFVTSGRKSKDEGQTCNIYIYTVYRL